MPKSQKKKTTHPTPSQKSTKILLLVLASIAVLLFVWKGKQPPPVTKTSEAEPTQRQTLEQPPASPEETEEEKRPGQPATPTPQLPDTFPSDVPLYPGATLEGIASNQKAISVSLKTQDEVAVVETFYRANLEKAGWTIGKAVNLQNATVFGISKNAVEGAVAITRNEEETAIFLSFDLEM